jgi:hypothetical protein
MKTIVYLHSFPANVPACPIDADIFQTNDGGFIAYVERPGDWQGWLFQYRKNIGSWVSWRKATPEDVATIEKTKGNFSE